LFTVAVRSHGHAVGTRQEHRAASCVWRCAASSVPCRGECPWMVVAAAQALPREVADGPARITVHEDARGEAEAPRSCADLRHPGQRPDIACYAYHLHGMAGRVTLDHYVGL
jgi:hypothetical protein